MDTVANPPMPSLASMVSINAPLLALLTTMLPLVLPKVLLRLSSKLPRVFLSSSLRAAPLSKDVLKSTSALFMVAPTE